MSEVRSGRLSVWMWISKIGNLVTRTTGDFSADHAYDGVNCARCIE